MSHLTVVPEDEFRRLQALDVPEPDRLRLVADACRLNALAAIQSAGSGHPGSSLSCLDIVATLFHAVMDREALTRGSPHRDIFFSSKGHDAPGLYAVLHSLGLMPLEQLLRLRREGGPCGHPDVRTPYVEAATGSLGMGPSKGKGMALAKKLGGHGGRVIVMTGDGELQEGQIWETLASAAALGLDNLHCVVDHNTVQSDKRVDQTLPLGELMAKLRAFGWHAAQCDGHDPKAVRDAFAAFEAAPGKPRILVAHTVKGRGVSFMEHPEALARHGGWYPWHSGAPCDEDYARAVAEILDRLNHGLRRLGQPDLATQAPERPPAVPRPAAESVADAYGQALLEMGRKHERLVALDADLINDCRVRAFAEAFPERFVECGIAEQDMVSTAGGLARRGYLPVVHSFAAFLASRANEQMYNNACEGARIVYACHYAGLLPAGPGHTHQSVRDISLLAALPDFTVIQPANPIEARQALIYAVEAAPGGTALRLPILASPRRIELPPDYAFLPGRGTILRQGRDAALFAYGPIMLHEALTAAERLQGRLSLKVVNMPWLNRIDPDWLAEVVGGLRGVFVVEDHAPAGGLGDRVLAALAGRRLLGGLVFQVFGVTGIPAWGTPDEALQAHGLDGRSLAEGMLRAL